MAPVSSKYILNSANEPVPCDDIMEWSRWFQTADRIVAKTDLAGEVKVSTIFLGRDRSDGGDVPLLWETMIFGGEHGGYQERFATHIDALAGHAAAVALASPAATS